MICSSQLNLNENNGVLLVLLVGLFNFVIAVDSIKNPVNLVIYNTDCEIDTSYKFVIMPMIHTASMEMKQCLFKSFESLPH